VLTALIKRAASTTPEVFQVGVIDTVGWVCVPFKEADTFRGVAVEPRMVAIPTRNCAPAPEVAATFSVNLKAVLAAVVSAQFQV
jgi:hypothetical protein